MPKGHFNIIQPGLQIDQIQLALPVKATETGIVRGSAIVNDNNEWRRGNRSTNNDQGSSAPGKVVYWSLQDQDSPDAIKANRVGALPCTWPMVVETDQYASNMSYTLGQFLSVANVGVVGPHIAAQTACGIVTAVPATRWVNDRLVADNTRRGTLVSVIRFMTVYIPNLDNGITPSSSSSSSVLT
jgi:hypothetical protein